MSSKSNVIALKSILYKEINRFMRIWVQTLVPPAITISLSFVILFLDRDKKNVFLLMNADPFLPSFASRLCLLSSLLVMIERIFDHFPLELKSVD